MPLVDTPLTRLFGVDLPIVSAPMAFASTAEMAAAVSGSGGLGMLGAGFDSSEDLKKDFQKIRDILGIKNGEVVPVGIGFIGWILDRTEVSDDPRIPAVLDERPKAIFFAFGSELKQYVLKVREYEANHEHKTLIIVNVNSVEDAIEVAKWPIDVIVAQGIEGGGHGGSEAPPLFSLLPAVVSALPSGPPVLAAGGITTGSQIAAVLTMGASGAVIGTRFLFSHECCYSDDKKEVLLKTPLTRQATIRTLAFDEVGRTMGWPPKHDGRAINNEIIRDAEKGLSLEERQKLFDADAANGSASRLIIWAGVGAGLTSQLQSAKEIVEKLKKDLIRAFERVASYRTLPSPSS